MSQFKVPDLGEGVMEGELVKWLVKVGDSVVDDQPICELMTDKATVEVPSPFTGTVTELNANEGDTVTVGQVLISYDGKSGGGAKKEKKKEAAPVAPAPAPEPTAPQVSAPQTSAVAAAPPRPATSAERVLAAPSTRRLASELGVDLAMVSGSGPSGRVMKTDVQKFASGGGGGFSMAVSRAPGVQRNFPKGGEERVPFKGLRKKISEKMRESKDHAAHFTYVEEADCSDLVKLRKEAKEIGASQGVKVTYLPFIMKAMVSALRQYPILNSELDEKKGELIYKHFYNISLSVQTEDGLMAPVVKNVEHKSIFELARDIQDLVQKAHAKRLAREDFQGGTITLTNAGTIGGLFATPVINYPEVAILGFNKIFKKPVVKEINGQEKIVIRPWTYFSISLDHRVVDGAVGAEFMKTFIRYVETPSLMVLDSF